MNNNDEKISQFDRILLRFFPNLMFKRFAKRHGIEKVVFDKLHEIFADTNRIDIFPLSGGGGSRGFMIVIDRKTALYFYQDHDHFKYDGFEMGEYGDGDVTIFDRIE